MSSWGSKHDIDTDIVVELVVHDIGTDKMVWLVDMSCWSSEYDIGTDMAVGPCAQVLLER